MTDKDYINENINPSVENRAQTEVFFFLIFFVDPLVETITQRRSLHFLAFGGLYDLLQYRRKNHLYQVFQILSYCISFLLSQGKPFYRLQQVQKTPKFTFGPTNRTFLHRLRVHLLSVNIKTPNTYVLVFLIML